ncbi:MAG: hypothetical protein AAF270_13675 [Pseudomonadota bacterium]
MPIKLVLSVLAFSVTFSWYAYADNFIDMDVPGGKSGVFKEVAAKQGMEMYCQFKVEEVYTDPSWLPLVTIMLDEGQENDKTSQYVKVKTQFVPDEDGTISHSFSTGGFERDFDEPFLMHWQRPSYFVLRLAWTSEGVIRYAASYNDAILGAGVFSNKAFEPVYFRVALSGVHAAMACDVESVF